jgi:hypothetical protein
MSHSVEKMPMRRPPEACNAAVFEPSGDVRKKVSPLSRHIGGKAGIANKRTKKRDLMVVPIKEATRKPDGFP